MNLFRRCPLVRDDDSLVEQIAVPFLLVVAAVLDGVVRVGRRAGWWR